MSEENVLKAELNKPTDKSSKVAGALIVAGLVLLTFNLLHIHLIDFVWPAFIIGFGALLILPASNSNANKRSVLSFLAVAGAMTIALGVLLFLMNLVNHYDGMAYSWTLLLAAGAAGYAYIHRFDESKEKVEKANSFIRTMVLLFMGMAAFFELIVFQSLGAWWPVLIVGLGLYLFAKNKRSDTQ